MVALFFACVLATAVTTHGHGDVRAMETHQVSKLLHRIMLPRADGKLECHTHFNNHWDAAEFMERFRKDFYKHNSGWTEYVWGADNVKVLVDKSDQYFKKHPEHNLTDFAEVFNNMDRWMYQQDTIRHLILYRFGGVYMDLDMDCKADLFDIIGNQSLVLRGGGKTNFMAMTPGQDFSLKMLQRIRDTFKDGSIRKVPSKDRPSAIALTGEKQICATLKEEYNVIAWKVPEEGVVVDNDVISIKLTGGEEVENWSDNAKCSHNTLNAWTHEKEMPDAPEGEEALAELCSMVYDSRTTWGLDLKAKILQQLD